MKLCSGSLSYRQLANLKDALLRLCGFRIDLTCREALDEVVKGFIEAKGFQGAEGLIESLKNDSSLETAGELIDRLICGPHALTLNSVHFDYIRSHLLPELKGRRLKIWITGCSSGEMAYSLAILLQEEMQSRGPSVISILATDIGQNILSYARDGIYEEEAITDLPADVIERYFTKEMFEDRYLYHTRDPISKMVRAASLNPVGAWPMRGPFDMIFCRNLFDIFPSEDYRTLVYHDITEGNSLLSRYRDILSADGCIFVTHHECGTSQAHQFVIGKRSLLPAMLGSDQISKAWK
jgi:chemotaxis methyl-accepting protein methylase